MSRANEFDVIIVGAGFAGLYMLYRARQLGLRARVLETGAGVGGTWYWNRYPGARCDVESVQYSYQFSAELQQEWRWTEKYATQPEILRYIEHVADRFDLRRDVQLNARVSGATFDEANNRWVVSTASGQSFTGRFLVLAVGCLSAANRPDIPGVAQFVGKTYHTGHWPHTPVNFSGQRVAVIGTGSSGIQCIPFIAAEAKHLTVLQRTPNYAVPAWNEPLDEAADRNIKSQYPALRASAKERPTGYAFPFDTRSALAVSDAERAQQFERFWRLGGLKFLGAFGDLFIDPQANAAASQFVQAKIRAKIVDPKIADRLVPKSVIGSKRLCVESNYYETFNRPNVDLIDLRRAPLQQFTPRGVQVADRELELDAVVFATGFDAMTGSLLRIDPLGRGRHQLSVHWREGPRTYLGLCAAGFPNLFMINAPGSPSVLSNMVQSVEHHVEWIANCLGFLQAQVKTTIEATHAAEQRWQETCAAAVDRTLRASEDSWYVGANIAGRPRVFMPYAGGVPAYLRLTAEVAQQGYAGFDLS